MSDTKFRPVQGTDELIQNAPYTEGYVYFATDSGKIYLDAEGERRSLGGGGASILYGEALEVKENVDGTYSIQASDLSDPSLRPKADDLIINTDGRFFKVIDFDGMEIYCSLIAVSGTGGGGGGSGDGGGGGGTAASIKLEVIQGVRGPYIFGQPAYTRLKASAADDYNVTYTFTIQSSDGTKKSIQRSADVDVELSFDIGSELYKGLNLVTITVSGANSGSITRRYTNVNCIEMLLKESQNFNPLRVVNGELIFYCRPVGVGLTKTLKIYVDDEIRNDLTKTVTSSDQDISISIVGLDHGYHSIRAVLSTGEGASEVTATPLRYEVAFAEDGNNLPIIWLQDFPTKIVNHDKLVFKYKVYNPENTARAEVRMFRNQEEIPTSPITVSYSTDNLVWEQWSVTNYEVGTNIFTISCGDVTRNMEIIVEEDTTRDLDILTAGLLVNLDSKGRSNKENITSREKWSYTTTDGNTTTEVKFNNFNWYNNGWIIDDNGDSCLRISNGASISIPLSVMNSTKLTTALTFEFQFKLRNVQNLSTLVTTTSKETEQGVVVTKTVSSNEGVFAKYFGNDAGWCLGTQEAYFKAKGNSLVNARYTDNDMVYLTFVVENKANTPLMYIYLNGILSGIAAYDTSETFDAKATEMIFNSDYCDVDLYKVRVYKVQLNIQEVVHNHIADLADANIYDMNQIIEYTSTGIPKINFNAVLEYNNLNPDNQTMPYAVLEISQLDDTPNDEKLPFVKGGKRKLDVTFVNPALDRALAQGEISDSDYLTKCPSFKATGAQFDVQGTSSQGYPRRNYKGKFKDTEWVYTNGPLKDKNLNDKNEFEGKTYKKYYMDNKDAAESTFTWKADYMESSGTHNTGFASFVKTLYSKHPLNDYLSDYVMGDHRTTVYGFPMMVFQKYHNGDYEFIGKYNFNLDKGCNNVIDFENETEHPFVSGKKIADVAECWELCNNQHTRCSFKYVNFAETNAKGELTVLDDFEYRYHVDEDNIDAAIDRDSAVFPGGATQANAYLLQKYSNLEKLCLWLESTDTAKATNEPFETPQVFSIKIDTGEKNEEGNIIYNEINETFESDTAEYRRTKFTYEFTKHFDAEYCYIYFIMTELLLQYDSRGKNMMLATWGPKEEGGEYIWYPIFYDIDTQLGVNNSGVPTWEYDTEATRDNQFSTADSVLWTNLWNCFSTPIKNKYIEIRKTALTIENLNGYYDFNPTISKSYAMMGNRPMNMVNVDEYFKYIAPAFTGYVDTSGNEGVITDLYFYCLQGDRELHRKNFLRNRFNYIDSQWLGGPYSREAVLQELKMRYNANDALLTSDKFVTKEPIFSTDDPTQMGETEKAAWDKWQAFKNSGGQVKPYKESILDADADFIIEPYLKQYVSVFFDDTPTTPVFYDGKNPVTVNPLPAIQEQIEESPSLSQQLVYLGGVEYVSKFGDLSLKYLNEFAMNKAVRLKELYVGSENAGYTNGVMKDEFFSLAAGATATGNDGQPITNPYGKPLLETVVLTNISTITSPQDLTSCEKLKTFRALGTGISGVRLADGVPIDTLYLPKTITFLNLTEPTSLSSVLTKKPIADEEGKFPQGLYIEGLTDSQALDKIRLDSINIKGGNMGYLTYNFLQKTIGIKEAMQSMSDAILGNEYSRELRVDMESVDWSPYRQVGAGESASVSASYFLKTEHYTFEPYTIDDNWNSHTVNGRVYEYDAAKFEANKDIITDLSILDKFITSYESAENYFKSNTTYVDDRKTIPYMSGNIFVNNSIDNPISESEIKNKYNNKKYFPDLNIFVTHSREAYTAKFVEVQDNGVEYVWDTLKYEPDDSKNQYPLNSEVANIKPQKTNYDFIGWSTKPNPGEEDVLIEDFEVEDYKFSNENKVYTFYAIYEKHPYTISFYNYDGKELLAQIQVPYNDYLYAPDIMPYKDDSNLAMDMRYGFKGYTTDKNMTEITNESQIKDVVVDLTTLKSYKDWTFYAAFMQESVYDSVLSNDYFEFANESYSENGLSGGDTQYDVPDGVLLTIKKRLAGKVTLPTVSPDGRPITAISTLAIPEGKESNVTLKDVTYIFWDKAHSLQLRKLNPSVFADAVNLKFVQLNDEFNNTNTLRWIGNGAFMRCRNLEMYDWSYNIFRIDDQAFNAAYNRDRNDFVINELRIGPTVQRIGTSGATYTGAFGYMNVTIAHLIFGTEYKPSQLNHVLAQSFNMNDDFEAPKVTVWCSADNYDFFNEHITTNKRGGFIPCNGEKSVTII